MLSFMHLIKQLRSILFWFNEITSCAHVHKGCYKTIISYAPQVQVWEKLLGSYINRFTANSNIIFGKDLELLKKR